MWASDITTLVTPGGTITCNAATGNTFLLDPDSCSGFGMGAIRNPVDDKGQTSGFIKHNFFEQGSYLVLGGIVVADTTANREAMEQSLKAALRSILNVAGTLNSGSSGSVSVYCNVGCTFGRALGVVHNFSFGLMTLTAL